MKLMQQEFFLMQIALLFLHVNLFFLRNVFSNLKKLSVILWCLIMNNVLDKRIVKRIKPINFNEILGMCCTYDNFLLI